ncbi:sugar MFS transporter [Caulobacter sp. NIBR2454]|uniref:sugar MFS transporter n=1 Tax=Caulobacter sp. NIBR2454 TaxID=3015996 RepID=UPI0022B701FA|nr:sugar MFS transporter [Caulobacter sp. NIBR2454]
MVQVGGASVSAGVQKGGGFLLPWVIVLFFAWGFSTCLVDLIAPALKAVFTLTNFEAGLTQFAFFLGYFVISLPASALVSKLGYLRSIVVGLLVMMVGCLLFAPAANAGVFWGFLAALFILASGITILQVAANPVVTLLGKPETASSRLTFAQFLNSFGTFIAPFIGSAMILSHIEKAPDPATLTQIQLETLRHTQAQAVQAPYMIIAGVLAVLALIFFLLRNHDHAPKPEKAPSLSEMFGLLGHKRLAFAVLCIFLYVGAEVSIGTYLTNYLSQPDTLGLSLSQAGHMVAYYWGGAMVGRLIGAWVLARVSPGKVLAFCAVGAAVFIAISAFSTGVTAGYAIIAVGLFNSVMFPTIFSLGLQGMGVKMPAASGLLCMAIVGGALLPPATGLLGDHVGLGLAFLLPAVCYLVIALFGWTTRKPFVEVEPAPTITN